MTTIKVSLPDELIEFVETHATQHGYASRDEFLCELINQEKDRTTLRGLLIEGMDSGMGSEMGDNYFDKMRDHIRNSESA